MFSIYVHIPFCQTKCKYCSFQVCPKDLMDTDKREPFIIDYIQGLKNEIDFYAEIFGSEKPFSLYFGGGTPSIIWVERVIEIIDYIWWKFDMENLAELSIELNPYPEEDILDFVQTLWKKYKNISRLRFSFWIQSFDNKVLKETWRESSFPGLVSFLRNLRPLKKDNMVFNFDLISFGIFNKTKKGESIFWNQNVFDFFEDFVWSHLADSFSLYTLELFEGSWDFYREKKNNNLQNDEKLDLWDREDLIVDEFEILKSVIEDAGYDRYEISNFSLPWKSSIHNRVYRDMENYIWIWTSACGFLKNSLLEKIEKEKQNKLLGKFWMEDFSSNLAIRVKNTFNIKKYCEWDLIWEIERIDGNEFLFEKFFLSFRMSWWVKHIDEFSEILVKDYENLIQDFQEQWLLIFENWNCKLTDEWFLRYNYIVTELVWE